MFPNIHNSSQVASNQSKSNPPTYTQIFPSVPKFCKMFRNVPRRSVSVEPVVPASSRGSPASSRESASSRRSSALSREWPASIHGSPASPASVSVSGRRVDANPLVRVRNEWGTRVDVEQTNGSILSVLQELQNHPFCMRHRFRTVILQDPWL